MKQSFAIGNDSEIGIIETIGMTGQWQGHTAYAFHINGRRAGFTSTSVLNDVKEFDNGVADAPILANSNLDILSSSANDTAAGTGVRQVKVVYLDVANNLVESPPINLNGVGVVANALTGVNALYWMEAFTTGTGLVAAGNIRLRINGGTVEVEQISAGGNKSLSARMVVPGGFTGFIPQWDALSVNADQDVRLRATMDSLTGALVIPFHFVDNLYVALNSGLAAELPFIKLPPLCRVKISTLAAATGANNRVDSSFIVLLIQN